MDKRHILQIGAYSERWLPKLFTAQTQITLMNKYTAHIIKTESRRFAFESLDRN